MKPYLAESVVVRTLRWLARDSVVARGAVWAAKPFRRVDAVLARAAADKDARLDNSRLTDVVRQSWLVQTADAVFAAPGAAWRHSSVRPYIESVRGGVEAMLLWERVRLLGWMVAVALITRAALFIASGAPLTGTTLVVWGVVLALAALMAIAARQIAVAWTVWRQRKRA